MKYHKYVKGDIILIQCEGSKHVKFSECVQVSVGATTENIVYIGCCM